MLNYVHLTKIFIIDEQLHFIINVVTTVIRWFEVLKMFLEVSFRRNQSNSHTLFTCSVSVGYDVCTVQYQCCLRTWNILVNDSYLFSHWHTFSVLCSLFKSLALGPTPTLSPINFCMEHFLKYGYCSFCCTLVMLVYIRHVSWTKCFLHFVYYL